jgi:hypothetical protein
MKISELILSEDAPVQQFGKISALNGDKATIQKPDGTTMDVDAKTLMLDPTNPNNATIDTSTIQQQLHPGMQINAATHEEISDEEDTDLMGSGHNHDVGGDATDNFIDDVTDKDAQAYGQGTPRPQMSRSVSEELSRWKRIAGL